jgi:rhodanese-related sulfurtransferase
MATYQTISIDQACRIMENEPCTVLDIRDEQSYKQSRLPNAIRFDDKIIRRMRKTGQHQSAVLVYCYHGVSSRDISKMLCDFGFTSVYNLEGGFAAWQTAQQKASCASPEMDKTSELATWISQQGFDPGNLNGPDPMGMTALMHASRLGLPDKVQAIIGAGADINLTNNDGNNALWLACFSGDSTTIQTLIQSGVNIDQQNSTLATALMYSASAGKADVVNQLLNAGANPNLKSQDDFTAFDLAATPQVYRLLRNLTERAS